MIPPKFTLDDVRYADSAETFLRAKGLYESGKVRNIVGDARGYTATVLGSSPYRVGISNRYIDRGNCDCYLGQNEYLCKHMIALGLAVLYESGAIDGELKAQEDLSEDEAKQKIVGGMKKLRPYSGPSRIWFQYTGDLRVGCDMIEAGVSALPPSEANVKYLWNIVKRIDRKLAGGIDDSDGAVGTCANGIVEQIASWAKSDEELLSLAEKFTQEKTDFDFEDDLRSALDMKI